MFRTLHLCPLFFLFFLLHDYCTNLGKLLFFFLIICRWRCCCNCSFVPIFAVEQMVQLIWCSVCSQRCVTLITLLFAAVWTKIFDIFVPFFLSSFYFAPFLPVIVIYIVQPFPACVREREREREREISVHGVLIFICCELLAIKLLVPHCHSCQVVSRQHLFH